jgi:hypothetical protein
MVLMEKLVLQVLQALLAIQATPDLLARLEILALQAQRVSMV